MSYKNKAGANRDALFGGGGGPKHKRNAASNRDALFGGAAGGSKKTTTKNSSAAPPAKSSSSSNNNRAGYTSKPGAAAKPKNKFAAPNISPALIEAKRKEAEDYKLKANKCMESGFFKKPDPVAASTFFKRAADCYKQIADYRLERHYRLAAADCNMRIGAWASAADDYARAAELVLEYYDEYNVEEQVLTLDQRRQDACSYHKKAAEAWTQMNERAKAAQSQVAAAIALHHGEAGTLLGKEALAGLEEAVEAFVPDVLNPYARYRQTGHSAFVDPNSDETAEHASAETLQLAESHIVSRAYAHEPLQDLVYMLVQHGEYAAALYAAGAATTLLLREGLSTLTVSRAFCTETILLLAMGDPIAAEERFLNSHVQQTAYLSSRECKLSEDLFRAIKMRDGEALDEARDKTGSNRAALANLHESLRILVTELRLSGVARKQLPLEDDEDDDNKNKKKTNKKSGAAETKKKAPEPSLNEVLNKKTGYEQDIQQGQDLNAADLQDEMDALNFDTMSGDGSDDNNPFGDDELDELEDDDIDLR